MTLQPKKPQLSVITPVFNRVQTVSYVFDSLARQSCSGIQHIIVDGQSTDGTIDRVTALAGRDCLIISEQDEGIYDAMNKGIDCSTGNWIFFLGSDDYIFSENTFSKIVNWLCSDVNFICGNIEYTSGSIFKSTIGFKTNIINTCHHQACFYKRDLFNSFRYDISYKIVSDYEINFLIYKNKVSHQIIDLKVAFCCDQGVSHKNSKINDYFDLFKIRSNYINYLFNTFFLAIGLANYFRRKVLL